MFVGCPPYTFQCGDGKCLPEYELCNAVVTCVDKSDELEGLCGGSTIVTVVNNNGTTVTRSSHQHHQRSPHQHYRHQYQQLQPPLTRVRGAYRHSLAECPFRCRNGRCRSTAVLCSGRDGCGDGSDESGCSVCSKHNNYYNSILLLISKL